MTVQFNSMRESLDALAKRPVLHDEHVRHMRAIAYIVGSKTQDSLNAGRVASGSRRALEGIAKRYGINPELFTLRLINGYWTIDWA